MKWEVLLYVTPTGREVVKYFLDGLSPLVAAKTARQIELLELYGIELGMPHTKSVGGGVHELRVRGRQEVRLLYVYMSNRHVVVVHGFIKKTQAIPKQDLQIARKRYKELYKK